MENHCFIFTATNNLSCQSGTSYEEIAKEKELKYREIFIDSNFFTFSQEMLFSLLESGFTKSILGRELGISRTTIYKILNGKVRNPNRRTFYRLLCLYCARCYVNKLE